MKFSSIVAVLALLGVVSVEAVQVKNKLQTSQVEKSFNSFVSKFQRNYKSQKEYQTRLSNFAKNLEIVNQHNAQNVGYQLELNKFADLSNAEYKSMLGFRADLIEDNTAAEGEFAEVDEGQTYPTAFNWVSKTGIISNVKNQASCGSCYSFASMEALQALYQIKKGPAIDALHVINLSEQQVVDCSKSYGNNGCSGGLMEYVYKYLAATPIMLEADYPYTAKVATCKYSSTKGQFKTTGYSMITKNNPTAHVAALQTGPVAIALAASSSTFQLYKSGIISSTACGTKMDHAVTLVGYGNENGTDYWLIKNSWGATWGESGYLRIVRNMSGTDSGICGLLQHSVQPTGINV